MDNSSLRDQIKLIVKEVLNEEFGTKVSDDSKKDYDEDRTNERGRVKDPEHDRRLKGNRGDTG